MPDFIPPMRATLADAAFDDPDWLFEIKWDGYRVEAVIRDGRARLDPQPAGRGAVFPNRLAGPAGGSTRGRDRRRRGGRPRRGWSPELQPPAGPHGIRTWRTPGSGQKGEPAPAVFQAFDLLHLDGRSLLAVPLEERKRLLRSRLRPHPRVRYAGHVEHFDQDRLHRGGPRQQLEGIVAKLRRSPYEPGRRAKSWLKIKLRREQEVVVVGRLEGQGRTATSARSSSRCAAATLGPPDRSDPASTPEDQARAACGARRAGARYASVLDPAPRLRGSHWVEPKLVIRVEFADWTADDLLRQAAFKGLEVGKAPTAVRREREADTAAICAAAGAGAHRADRRATMRRRFETIETEGVWAVGGHELRVTNTGPLPRPRRRAADARNATCFATTSPSAPLVPYLRDHGLTVQRFPNGVEQKGFWQKDLLTTRPIGCIAGPSTTARRPEGLPGRRRPRRAAMACPGGGDRAASVDLAHHGARPPVTPSSTSILARTRRGTRWWPLRACTACSGAPRRARLSGVTGKRGIQVWIGIRPGYAFDETRTTGSRAVAGGRVGRPRTS